jgi:proteasome lid subunit RPN8/RPN11
MNNIHTGWPDLHSELCEVKKLPYQGKRRKDETLWTTLHIIRSFTLHNHPTGDPTPSQEDIAITRRLKESGEILGIKVLDHIIIGDDEFLSFVERGLL